jgi:hypothetical protein
MTSIISFPRRVLAVITLSVFVMVCVNGQLKEISYPNVHSEGRFYLLNGVVYCDAIVIKFNTEVIRLGVDERLATKDQIVSPDVRALLDRIETKHGRAKIIKQIPGARYGDVVRINKRTGKQVRIIDLSQLFTLKFSEPVDLDKVLGEFNALDVVEYAEQPVSVVYYVSPNDPHYTNGDQWGLDAVNEQDQENEQLRCRNPL